MKKQILTISIILYLIIHITSCPTPQRYYIALGDSVSAGYGLTSPEESHPAVFFNLIKNDDYIDDYINMSVSGFTTSMLLEYLNNFDAEELRIIKNAHVITLNIGGNNILVPFLNYLSDSNFFSGVENIKLGTESVISGAYGIISGIKTRIENISSEQDDNNAASAGVISGISDVITGFGSIIIGTGEVISGYPEFFYILTGTFSPELKDTLENGVQTFSDDFINIITWIKERAPKAVIIVNTIYNPIPHEVLRSSVEISIAANLLIESMNSIIIQESKSGGYLVTDIYSHLSYQLNMMKFNINPSVGDLSFDIIHPNAEGHNLIALLNYETFKQRNE